MASAVDRRPTLSRHLLPEPQRGRRWRLFIERILTAPGVTDTRYRVNLRTAVSVEQMKSVETALVIAGAVALVIWRAVALYQESFKRKNR